jgi:hypothetical protein
MSMLALFLVCSVVGLIIGFRFAPPNHFIQPRHCACYICNPVVPHKSERVRKRFTRKWPHLVATGVAR